MVSVKTIDKIINKIITKHAPHITIQDIKNIITDKEDAKILHKDLIKFYNKIQEKRKQYTKEHNTDFPYEVGCGKTISGENYSNFENKEKDNFEVPLELEYNGCIEGLFYNMHYHPNDELNGEKLKFTCFQSPDDVMNLLMLNTKYNITMGTDGFMIIENPNFNNKENHLNPNDYKGTLKKKTDTMVEIREDMVIENNTVNDYYDLYQEMYKDYEKVISKYDTDNKLNTLNKNSEKYKLLNESYFSNYISDNVEKYVDKFNTNIKEININYIHKK